MLTEERRRQFVRSSKRTIDRFADTYERYSGRPAAEATALDFGCGVGRLAIPATDRFARVVGVDLSAGHLAETKRNLALVDPDGTAQLDTFLMSGLDDAANLPEADCCYSEIVLQHNTPPVMAYFLKALLKALRPGGIAILHIPIHHPFYAFDTEEYLKDANAGRFMEVHVLPRETLRRLAEQVGYEIVDSQCTGGTRGVYSETFTFRAIGALS
ncbi:MAG: class I SAM-dependent methyltransferase [Pseudomonadota bacterium]